MPNTNDKELAIYEASKFYPIGLNKKPWPIGPSNSYIVTPTLYCITDKVLSLFLTLDLLNWFFSKPLSFPSQSARGDFQQDLLQKRDENEDDYSELQLQSSYIRFYIILLIPTLKQNYLRLGKSLNKFISKRTISWPMIWGSSSSGYITSMLWFWQRGAVLMSKGWACP